MKVKTLFVVAELQEAQPLIEYYGLRDENLCSIDLWSNGDFQLIITGPGVNNVIRSLSMASYFGILNPFVTIFNVGYAGGKGMDVGEVVSVKTCHCYEFPTKANVGIENSIVLSESGEGYDCYTSIDFVEDSFDNYTNVLFDMELAYIARFVYNSLYSIKIVSDNLSYDGFKSFNKTMAWEKAIEKIEERRKANVSRNITS